MGTIGIIDYGAGNLLSVHTALYMAGAAPVFVSAPDSLAGCDRLVLPGVGAAGEALARLNASHLTEALDEAVRVRATPLLGICLGMQMLAETLHEYGPHRGLGWIKGSVVPLAGRIEPRLAIPHMGWNQVTARPGSESFFPNGGGEFYFAHSYCVVPDDENDIAATTDYGGEVVTALRKDTIFAAQFHPEKSQDKGERLIAAFLAWKP